MSYYNDTLDGKHGKTAQFYVLHIQLIKYYLLVDRSIREGDFYLYVYVIPKLTNLFFASNQPNYARWLTKYFDNLIKIGDSHPDLIPVIQAGCFGTKRTLPRSPIDLTLEQTINADAANKHAGISFLTQSISARQRWARFHSMQADIISTILQITGLKKNYDCELTNELRDSRINRDQKAVKMLADSIRKHINPFDESLNKDSLFNIATGRGHV